MKLKGFNRYYLFPCGFCDLCLDLILSISFNKSVNLGFLNLIYACIYLIFKEPHHISLYTTYISFFLVLIH